MESLEFSVPYNERAESLEETFKLKNVGPNRITEVFLSGPQEFSASGRVMDKLETGAFLETVKKIHSAGLGVNLVMNPTCEGDDWYSEQTMKKKVEFIRTAHREYGVESVTIANPLYISEVRGVLPDIEICASVLGDIDSLQRARIFARLGANVITPEPCINRDLDLLTEIKKETGARLKIMVNEGCLYKCPFRKFHFNLISHLSRKSGIEKVFVPFCDRVISEDPAQILRSGWIRPEDVRKYLGITNFFKIVGRALPNSKVIRTIKAYLEERWDGDLMDITCSSLGAFALRHGVYVDNKKLGELGFFEKVTTCGPKCSRCRYCQETAERVIRVVGYTEEKMEDKDLGSGRIDYLRQQGLIT